MNKIHSKIWNRELGQLVVASELASCPRASATSGQAVRLQRPRAFLFGALAAAGGMAWSLAAQAQSVSCLPPPYNAYAGTSACIGYGAQAAGDGATALGASAASNGGGTVAVGYLSKATNLNAIAMGFNSRADAVNAINIGPTTGTATGARAESAIAIGTDVTVTSDSAGGIAIGSQARVTLGTAVALGAQAVASGQGATSIGLGTQSLGAHATAVGFQAYATALNALYLGPRTAGAGASAESAIGIGTDVSASGTYAVGIGLRANASQNNALSIGVDSASNATNGIAIGSLANSGAASTAGAFVDNWTPQSTQRRAGFVAGNMAVGASSIANNNGAAIGASAEATGAESFAGGAAAVASGRVGIAVGGASLASGDSAVAIGNTSTAGGDHSAALGAGAEAKAVGSLAVGFTAMANNTGDVALGSGSTTDMAVGTPGTTINGTAYTFQGITPTSTVSVGAAGVERTITNVAAGRISGSSTDAINGSQLFATNQAVDGLGTTVTNLGDSIATTIGGGTTYDPSTGTINTSVTYGGNTYNSLQQVFNQIDSSVDAATTRYYSVNDNGTQGGNYANDGASGVNALAAGVGATAVADNATALGQDTGVSVLGGVALGSGAVSDRAIAPTSGTITVGTNTVPYNTTDRNLLGAVSVGNATDFRQVTNVADGTEDQDAVTLRQLKGAMSSFSVTPIKYFHANSIAADSAAIGAESIAVGPQTTVNGDNGIGIGNHAIVQQTAPGGTAIGQDTTVNLADGVALGTNATSNAIQSMALGAGSQAAFVGSVALGAGSVTADKVATTGTTINGVAYTFAGGAPGSTVSVGDVGAERTITNVGAGRISNSSTDAINGSQLFAVQDAIGTVGNSVTNLGNTVTNLGDSIANSIGGSTTYDPTTGTINTSINYAGNTYNSVQQVFDQIGTNGIKYFHANSNLADSIAAGVNSVAIGPVSNASTDNAVSIGNGATAGSNVGDVALGAGSTTDTVVQTGGGTIAGTTYTYAGGTPTSTVSVGAPGAERTITNVAAGQVNGGSTDAVNGSQLFATNQALDSLNTTVINNATHYYSVNDNGTQGGNYANDGASGVNALAAGVGATAVADNATALGQDTGVSVLGGVARGVRPRHCADIRYDHRGYEYRPVQHDGPQPARCGIGGQRHRLSSGHQRRRRHGRPGCGHPAPVEGGDEFVLGDADQVLPRQLRRGGFSGGGRGIGGCRPGDHRQWRQRHRHGQPRHRAADGTGRHRGGSGHHGEPRRWRGAGYRCDGQRHPGHGPGCGLGSGLCR
jgi:autotransporter adhesin